MLRNIGGFSYKAAVINKINYNTNEQYNSILLG